MKKGSRRAARRPSAPRSTHQGGPLSKEELFTRLNASAARMLDALMSAYDAGLKAGFQDDEEDQVIELLRRAKHLRDEVKKITQA